MSYHALQAAALVDVQSLGLHPTEVIILYRLAFHHNRKTLRCFPSIEALATGGGISERSAWAALQSLAHHALIRIKENQGGSSGGRPSNAYDLLFVAAMRKRFPAAFAEKDQTATFSQSFPDFSATIAYEQGKEQGNKKTPVVPRGTGGRKEPSAKAKDITATIWALAPERAHKRSVIGKVERAVEAALGRGGTRAQIIGSMAAYYRDPDISREDYAYVQGVHLVIEGDKWRTWLPDPHAEPSNGIAKMNTPQLDADGIDPKYKPGIIESWRDRMQRWNEEGRWERVFGARPDEPTFAMPAFVREALGL